MLGTEAPREIVAAGVTRQLLGYDDAILMARVELEAGTVGDIHSHAHSQITYIESGEFDVHVDGVVKRLGPGDSVYIHPNLKHGVVCNKAGVLLDVFSPVREDFLNKDEQ